MSENQDEKLESMLRSRRTETVTPDLAGRIILQAQSLPQVQDISLWHAVRQLFAEFHLPKPGYVLASALVLGMVLGFTTAPENGQLGDASSATAQTYIAGDEELL
jgi:hypothetical protein